MHESWSLTFQAQASLDPYFSNIILEKVVEHLILI